MADVVLTVRWNGGEYEVALSSDATLADVKACMKEKTTVEPGRQKYVGLKTADGKMPNETTQIRQLLLKKGQKVVMFGTPDAVIDQTMKQAESAPEVKDDFDADLNDELSIDVRERPEVQEKLQRRLDTVQLKILNPPRPGKKLLVLDIDYTIFDLGSSAERVEELARPHLHAFLTACYEHFDLMIWSATSMKWVEIKMRELGVSNHPDYRLVCMLDHAAMVTVQTEKYGVFDCKPLEFIWRKFPEHYAPANTVMLDDLKRNFVMNRQNGLVIRPYRKAHRNRTIDRELLYLTDYFRLIGPLDSLSHLKHRKWEKYLRRAREGHQNPTSE